MARAVILDGGAASGRASSAGQFHDSGPQSTALEGLGASRATKIGNQRKTEDGRRAIADRGSAPVGRKLEHELISVVKRLLAVGGCSLLLASPLLAGLIPYVSNDRDFVRSGPKSGFYAISSNSSRWWNWGLVRAPVDEPTPFNHGYGTDAIAIPFDRNERVGFSPVYIYTIRPESFQEQRLAAIVPGVTTATDVARLFGRAAIKAQVRGTSVWYYEIRVFNPFQEYPGGDGRSK